MKIVHGQSERDPQTGKKKILIEIDEDDSIIIDQAIRAFEESGMYDPDDNKFKGRLNHNKEKLHEIWALLHPS